MNGILNHVRSQIFVTATGAAALVHSTWALGILFGGPEPTPADLGSFLRWLGWLAPALAISFALDVGQIYTAAEIRAGQRTRAKYLTFGVFAAFTYYLQWFHLAAHMPVVALSAGVSPGVAAVATGIRDLALWIIPALLPLSTWLYTISNYSPPPSELPSGSEATAAALVPVLEPSTGTYKIQCPICEKIFEKANEESARNALNGHMAAHRSLIVATNDGHEPRQASFLEE